MMGLWLFFLYSSFTQFFKNLNEGDFCWAFINVLGFIINLYMVKTELKKDVLKERENG